MWKRKMDDTNETEDEEYRTALNDAVDFQKRLLKQLCKTDIKKQHEGWLSKTSLSIVQNMAEIIDARREFTRRMETKRENGE